MVEKRIKPRPEDYVVELLSERGDRIVGWGPDIHAAHQCYDETVEKYPHDTVRLRQGTQPIALSMRQGTQPIALSMRQGTQPIALSMRGSFVPRSRKH